MLESGCGNLANENVRSSRYTLAQLSVLLLAGSVMYLGLYNMERQRVMIAKLRTLTLCLQNKSIEKEEIWFGYNFDGGD